MGNEHPILVEVLADFKGIQSIQVRPPSIGVCFLDMYEAACNGQAEFPSEASWAKYAYPESLDTYHLTTSVSPFVSLPCNMHVFHPCLLQGLEEFIPALAEQLKPLLIAGETLISCDSTLTSHDYQYVCRFSSELLRAFVCVPWQGLRFM